MKIAVLLFGHLRDFEACVDSLRKHVLNKYDCDVFMHTWDEYDIKTRTWHKQICEPVLFDKAAVSAIIEEKYAPKYYEITHQDYDAKQEELLQSAYFPDYKFSLTGMRFLMYSMNRANELRHKYEKEQGVSYDYVIVTRPDIYFHADLDIEKVVKQALCFELDMNNTRFFATDDVNSNFRSATFLDCCSDLLFFARSQVIDAFIQVNREIDKEYCKSHSLGINSIFTSREIGIGIFPIPIAFIKGKDWSFNIHRVSGMQEQNLKKKSLLNRIVVKGVSFLLIPFAYLFQRYPKLNRYR